MYCVIQFYVQLRLDLAPHKPFLKVVAIKLVIFLSFWQSFLISILTSATFNVVKPTAKVAYPDLKVGIPSLLLCIEMAIFAILHLFAFPYKPYTKPEQPPIYPVASGSIDDIGPKQGGFLGIKALVDAMNPWDLVKGFARGMRWLFVGRKTRQTDISYKASGLDFNNPSNENDMTLEATRTDSSYKGSQGLPIAEEFRRSKFGLQGLDSTGKVDDEGAGLIAHAQPNPLNSGGYIPARQRYDANGQDISSGGTAYDNPYAETSPDRLVGRNPTPGTVRRHEEKIQSEDIGMAISQPLESYQSHVVQDPYTSSQSQSRSSSQEYREQKRQMRQQRQPPPSEQWANSRRPVAPEVHNALWGQQDPGNQNQGTNQF
jgi:Organic solute transporter Ostalpha